MYPAGARALREDDNEMNAEREAVLSAWEQKALIDEPPLRQRRFQRAGQVAQPAEDAAPDTDAPSNVVPLAERRTVTISGQPDLRPRRRSATQQQLFAQPDRIALWAFLLGLFMVVVAAATANAAPL
jgi:hypothetical protein